MIATQNLISYSVFGDNATKSAPSSAKMSTGFIQADVLPAEWMNWAWYHNSKGISDLNEGVSSTEQELNAVVEAGGVSPSAEDNTQVLTAIQYLINQAKAEAILAAHPIGSLYWSSKSTNPSELFGGTWTQIKDKFVLAAGDTYTVGATGGNATVTLTESNLPAHTHSFTPSGSVSSHTHGLNGHTHSFSHTHGFTPSGSVTSTFTGTTTSHNHTIYANGGWNGASSSSTPWQVAGVDNSHKSSIKVAVENSTSDSRGISTAQITPSGTVSSSFSGSSGTTSSQSTSTTGGNSGNTTATQPTFTGSSGTTGSTGSGTAFSTLPPYIVKYCFERTA